MSEQESGLYLPEPFRMRKEEFEVVRDLIAGREPRVPAHRFAGHALAPASFREIDGDILARQYVAHRKFLETEALAQQFEATTEGLPEGMRLRGERRPIAAPPAEVSGDKHGAGWLSSLARFLWRR
jgi:hypothetical protein